MLSLTHASDFARRGAVVVRDYNMNHFRRPMATFLVNTLAICLLILLVLEASTCPKHPSKSRAEMGKYEHITPSLE